MRCVPAPILWDGATIRVERIAGRDLAQRVADGPGAALSIAAAAGRTLACVHEGVTRGAAPAARIRQRIALHRPGPEFVTGHSAAGIELVKMIQRSARLCVLLDELPEPQMSHFIHADLRWENVMVLDDAVDQTRVRYVDWEHAGIGDPAWDLGCFIASGVAAWLDSVPSAAPDTDLEVLERKARIDRRDVAGAMNRFLRGYACGRSRTNAQSTVLEVRAMKEAAVRPVHLALEATMDLEDLSLTQVLYLQVATNILADPDAALNLWTETAVCRDARGER